MDNHLKAKSLLNKYLYFFCGSTSFTYDKKIEEAVLCAIDDAFDRKRDEVESLPSECKGVLNMLLNADNNINIECKFESEDESIRGQTIVDFWNDLIGNDTQALEVGQERYIGIAGNLYSIKRIEQ